MPAFFDTLAARARQIDSLLCVGLDPHPNQLTENSAAGARDFCLRLIAATYDLALAYKPNVAFFEAYGPAGWQALQEVIAAVPEGIPVVLDAKRGDIAATAAAYARACFDTLQADAVTLNPYLGYDSLQPFLQDEARGAFLLCKTSNPGSVDLQDLTVLDSGKSHLLYEKVALLAQEWNNANNLGLVVGATQPEALARLRKLTPQMWFLTPGVGAQGGDIQAALAAGLREDGLGMLIPVSRAISGAADPHAAAVALVEQIRAAQKAVAAQPEPVGLDGVPEKLAEGLLRANCVRFGQFKLKSGLISPIYLDLRQLVSYPDVLAEVAAAYLPVLKDLAYDRLAGLPYAALPIATAISLLANQPMIYPRKEAKEYGTKALIEGEYHTGEQVVIIDDLATTGGSKFEVIEKLNEAGLKVEDVVVLIDRQSGAREALAAAGYRLHAVFTLTSLLDYWESTARVPQEQIDAARAFLEQA